MGCDACSAPLSLRPSDAEPVRQRKTSPGDVGFLRAAVYVAEAAQTLIQNVDYEIPFMRKQQLKHSQVIQDAERKHADYLKGAATCAHNFKQARDGEPVPTS